MDWPLLGEMVLKKVICTSKLEVNWIDPTSLVRRGMGRILTFLEWKRVLKNTLKSPYMCAYPFSRNTQCSCRSHTCLCVWGNTYTRIFEGEAEMEGFQSNNIFFGEINRVKDGHQFLVHCQWPSPKMAAHHVFECQHPNFGWPRLLMAMGRSNAW
jgi:hypothetical protein